MERTAAEVLCVTRGESNRSCYAVRHLDLVCKFKEEQFAIPEARKIMSYYVHDIKGASSARGKINTAATADEMKEIG